MENNFEITTKDKLIMNLKCFCEVFKLSKKILILIDL